MNTQPSSEQTLALSFAAAWNRLERRLDHSLGAIRGISLAEYRLLRALGDAPGSQASRVDLAQAVGLTPAGREVLNDASGVVDDTMTAMLKRTPEWAAQAGEITEMLDGIGR